MRVASWRSVILACGLGLALPAFGQDVVLPVLQVEVPAVYPAEALAAGVSASVVLGLDVDERGQVVRAEVTESAAAAGVDAELAVLFDAAALQAVRSYQFSPAQTASGEAVGVSIGYRVVFEPAAAPPLSVEGEARAQGTRERLVGVDLAFTRGEQRVLAHTDGEGRFSVAGLELGDWQLKVVAPGFREEELTVTVKEGKVAQVAVWAQIDRPWELGNAGVSEVIEVVGERPVTEVTERTLTREEARYLPGTNGDLIRVVQNLPGVARPPLGIGQLIIRGTAPEDSAYYIDGGQIPLVFHFAGFSTAINGELIEELAFLPGNYGVRYGRTLGGVVDLRIDTSLPKRAGGYVSVDIFQSTAFVETPIGETGALRFSARRSYADLIVGPAIGALSTAQIRLPRYVDAQVQYTTRTRNGGVLDTLVVVSDDRFSVVSENDEGVSETQIGLSTSFAKIRILSREKIGADWTNELVVSGGPERQAFGFTGGSAYEQPSPLGIRDELKRDVPTEGFGVGWRFGTDTQVGRYDFNFAIPGFGEPEGADASRVAPALYAEAATRINQVVLTTGLRGDALFVGPESAHFTADPRLGLVWERGPTTWKAAAGGYSQWATVRQLIEAPELRAQRSWQSAVGVTHKLRPEVELGANLFANRLTGLVSGREDAFSFFSGPPPGGPLDSGPYVNEGVGTILGFEGLAKVSSDRTTAWLSATVSRSTRRAREGGEAGLFRYDQPLVLTALASQKLSRNWRLGGRVRFGSGNPYTPVVNRVYNLADREYLPVYGAKDSERITPFWSIDVRVDREITFRKWALTAYLDVQNATNAQNVELIGYTADFRAQDNVLQIPLLPAFGLRADF